MKIDKDIKFTCSFYNPAHPDEKFEVTCSVGCNEAMLRMSGSSYVVRLPLEDTLIALQKLMDLTNETV